MDTIKRGDSTMKQQDYIKELEAQVKHYRESLEAEHRSHRVTLELCELLKRKTDDLEDRLERDRRPPTMKVIKMRPISDNTTLRNFKGEVIK